MKNKKKGFTLIELLVVIAIIGLLSTLAVVSLSGARAKARDAKRTSDLRSIQSALELYLSENAVAPVVGANWSATIGTLSEYLPGPIQDPSNGATYHYTYCRSSATTTSYLLGTTLEGNAVQPGVQGDPDTLYDAGDCMNSNDGAALPTACDATTGFCLGRI
ncbi:type II secretion system GspH family protein [Patescibacteria group bacterium]|nr:type II secretion system GspH family protein [Patescibacteria group bacterium]